LLDCGSIRAAAAGCGRSAQQAADEAQRSPGFYHAALKRLKGLSHITVEVNPIRAAA
jgi:hypothetical protein